MKQSVAYILFFISFSVFSQETDHKIKLTLDSLSKNQIQYLCNGEVDKYLNIYSKKYTDLGGGPNGDGTVDFSSWKNKLEQFVLSKKFDKIKGKSIEEVLDVENEKVLNYQEILQERGSIEKFTFKLREGDYLVSIPPKKESPFIDGWFGVFRFEYGQWKIIAGD